MPKLVNVHIGEVKVARKGETLQAILGSCVGIGVIWKEKKICGLAHALLPESPERTFVIGGRFVNQAFQSLVAMMKIRDEDLSQIELVIAGGGNMTSSKDEDSSELVGACNFRMALKEAKSLGLQVVHAEGGGNEGKKIIIDSTAFSYRIEKIPRISEAS